MYLRVCGLEALAWFTEDKKNEFVNYRGPMGNLIMLLSKRMNFTFDVNPPTEREWGVFKNGSWTGQIGMLEKNKSDLAIGPFAMTSSRSQVVDFPALITKNYLTILAGKSKDHPSDLFGALLSFDKYVWLGLIICFFVMLILLSLMDYIHLNRKRNCISRNLWSLIASFFCESSPNIPKAQSTRTLMAFWLLSFLVLMNGFSGNLQAMLLLNPNFDRIDTISDILKIPSLKVFIQKGTSYESYIQNSPDPEFAKLWNRIISTQGLLSFKDLYESKSLLEVQQGKSVIVSDIITMVNVASQFCTLLDGGSFYFGKQIFYPHTFSMAIRKNVSKSFYKDIRTNTRRIVEAGLFESWLQEMNTNWSLCKKDIKTQEAKALTMNEMKAILVLWSIGIGMSAMAFLYEMFIYAVSKSHCCR